MDFDFDWLWCWFLEKLIGLAVAMIQLVSQIMPSVAVPDWLVSTNFPVTDTIMSFFYFFFPLSTISWCLSALLLYEIAHFMVLVLYRAFMDLL